MLTSHTTLEIPPEETVKDQTWTLRVTPNDGFADGVAGEASITIENTAPGAPVVSISPGPADTEDGLVGSYTAGTDVDGDDITHAVSWLKDGVVTTHPTLDISSASDKLH